MPDTKKISDPSQLSFRVRQFFLLVFWYLPGYLLCLITFRFFSRTVVYGSAPGLKTKGCLLVSNHQSALDSWFVGHLCFPRPVWFPAKSELFEIPIVKHVISGWRAFPVKRGAHDYEAMDFTVRLLHRYLVLIHPEGTRNTTRTFLRGKVGVGKIIYDAKCHVIPVYFEGMDSFLPIGTFFPRLFRRLPIAFGEPIDFSDLFMLESSRETSQQIVDRVMEELLKTQREFFRREGIVSETEMNHSGE